MRHWILAIVLCSLSTGVAAQVPNVPYLAVQGQAEETLVPDIFPVAVTISETSTDAAATQANVEALARDVLAAAAKAGVADADIRVGNLRVAPQMEWDEQAKKQAFLGNLYERQFELRLRKLDALRALAAALPNSRSLRIQTQPFERSDADAIRARLRKQAVDDAKGQAQALAAAAGVRLGRLQNVSDRPQSWNYAMPMGRNLSSDSFAYSGSASNRINSEMIVKEGQITLRADAYLVYLIE